jgi:hypothetical protein
MPGLQPSWNSQMTRSTDRDPQQTPELPFHIAPPLTGRNTKVDAMAEVMSAHIAKSTLATDADMLKALRAAFPNAPLAQRVAALGIVGRRRRPAPMTADPRHANGRDHLSF